MADVLVEYSTVVKRTIDIPDEIYNLALTGNSSDKVANYFWDELWERVAKSDPNFIEPYGIYTTDYQNALAEY